MINQEQNNEKTFEILGEEFPIEYYPNIYKMYKNNPKYAEETLKSIADVWHEGSIVSAAQAFESDMAHG